ncbi:MAG: hypothetical protein R3272_12495 [Candidatus Promineifilaceae bacterium]|nr:hypothetical protein [Candidatus Promineifilaceae bacterium]
MTEGVEIIRQSVPDQAAANELLGKVAETARPAAVFGEPVTQGEYTAITAAEVSMGLGFGFGGGGGLEGEGEGGGSQNVGMGGGGGGAGGVMARPVAVIEIGPRGVRVEPIVDPTKIVLAFFTALGSMLMMRARMRRNA